jgi:hypothetical protein
MQLDLFEINGETWTRFKVLKSQYRIVEKILNKFGINKPSKESNRYIYFEVKGDFLN